MPEFSTIENLFAPLSAGFAGGMHLRDDAALLTPPEGRDLVITKDAMSADVHFFSDDLPEQIAKKLLRCNLSDLAAKGATPLCYFLALMLPEDINDSWLAAFVQGLSEDQDLYGIHLAGGDTIRTHGPLSMSLTAIGTVAKGAMMLRSGARVGDKIYASGTLGDSAIALAILNERLDVEDETHRDWLIERYQLPQPRMELSYKLIGHAHACMDISDGLIQDLGHLCAASGVGARILRKKLPLSRPVFDILKNDPHLWPQVYAGGDDYELLFTLSPAAAEDVPKLADALDLSLTYIGDIVSGTDVVLFDEHGFDITPKQGGYQHR